MYEFANWFFETGHDKVYLKQQLYTPSSAGLSISITPETELVSQERSYLSMLKMFQ